MFKLKALGCHCGHFWTANLDMIRSVLAITSIFGGHTIKVSK